jgi:hypothetical protein
MEVKRQMAPVVHFDVALQGVEDQKVEEYQKKLAGKVIHV